MRPATAIEELNKLRSEPEASNYFPDRAGPGGWVARVRSIFVRALGENNNLVAQLDKIRYHSVVHDEKSHARLRYAGLLEAVGLIDAAVYELSLAGGDEPVDEHAYDPDLWAHVKSLVEDAEWDKVASQTAIFVESHIRTWAGGPQDAKGGNLVGKQLYAEVFSDASAYRLGRQAGEFEGWRFLGMGFAQALSNVDRHRIQNRVDAKRYALGVLGIGSLLLTQLRFEHADILKTQ